MKRQFKIGILLILLMAPIFPEGAFPKGRVPKAAVSVSEIYSAYENYKADLSRESFEDFERAVKAFLDGGEYYKIQYRELFDSVERLGDDLRLGKSGKIDGDINSILIVQSKIQETASFSMTLILLFITVLVMLSVFLSLLYYFTILQKKRAALLAKAVLAELENERSRLSAELHDTVAQELNSCAIMLAIPSKNMEPSTLQKVHDTQVNAVREIRAICADLNAPDFASLGFESALHSLCLKAQEKSGIKTAFQVNDENLFNALDSEKKLHLYRIVQEALTNVQKHAGAKNISVLCGRGKDGGLFIYVNDDGRGFDLKAVQSDAVSGNHIGLSGIKRRAALIGAQVCIETSPGSGCQISIRI